MNGLEQHRAKAFASAIKAFARRAGGQQRGEHWVATIDGVEVAISAAATRR